VSVVFPKPDPMDGWQPVKPYTPGVSEWTKVVKNNDGSTDTFTQKWIQSTGSRTLSSEHVVESTTNGVTTTTVDFHETEVSAQGQGVTTSEHDVTVATPPFDKTWETTYTDSQGQVTTEHGVSKRNFPDPSGTETVNTISPDGSVQSQTVTWSDSTHGTRYTEVVDKNGNIVSKSDLVPVWMARDGSWEDKPPAASGDGQPESEQGDPGAGDAGLGEFGPDGPISDPDDDPEQPNDPEPPNGPASSGTEGSSEGSTEGSSEGSTEGSSEGSTEGSSEGSGPGGDAEGPGDSNDPFVHVV
jgi:hypothetical protein